MKIAFATLYDLRDVRRGSGTYHFMSRELERQGHSVEYVGPLEITNTLPTRLLRKFAHLTGKKYRTFQDIFVTRNLGRQATQKIAGKALDCILTNDYGIAGYIQTNKPVVLYTDAIFPHNYRQNSHPWLENLSPASVLFSQIVTRRGLLNADLCIFPTQWTKGQAAAYGRTVASKSRMIPFGANLDDPGVEITSNRDFSKIKEKNEIHLLFIGTDWKLKGGEIVVAVARELRKQGISAILHIVGKDPIQAFEQDNIFFYGYLDKVNPADKAKLIALFISCDVFIMPSQAEGYGIVFAEAAAFGLPSLAFNTTGIAEIIQNGKNGWLLPLNAKDAPEKFAKIICGWFENPNIYNDLSNNSRSYYEIGLNWQTSTSNLIQAIQPLILEQENCFETKY